VIVDAAAQGANGTCQGDVCANWTPAPRGAQLKEAPGRREKARRAFPKRQARVGRAQATLRKP